MFSNSRGVKNVPVYVAIGISLFTINAILMLFCEYAEQDNLCSCSHAVFFCLNLVSGSVTHYYIRRAGICLSLMCVLQFSDSIHLFSHINNTTNKKSQHTGLTLGERVCWLMLTINEDEN